MDPCATALLSPADHGGFVCPAQVSNFAVWHNFEGSAAHPPLVLPHSPPQHIKKVMPDIFTISVWVFWKPGSRKSPISSQLLSTAFKMLEPCKVLVEERRWTPPPVALSGTKQLSAYFLNVFSCSCLPAGAELLSYAVGPALVQWTGCRSHLIIIEVTRKERNKGRREGEEKHVDKLYSIILW